MRLISLYDDGGRVLFPISVGRKELARNMRGGWVVCNSLPFGVQPLPAPRIVVCIKCSTTLWGLQRADDRLHSFV